MWYNVFDMKTQKVVVEFEVNEHSIGGLTELIRAINYCAQHGASRGLEYYCDGDGSSPNISKVTVDGVEFKCPDLPGSDNFRELLA